MSPQSFFTEVAAESRAGVPFTMPPLNANASREGSAEEAEP